jgi:hypothetical protein
MPRLSYNNVDITVPVDWVDSSIIRITAPEVKGLHARASVIVTSDTLIDASVDLTGYVKAQQAALQRETKAYKLIRSEAMTVGADPGIALEHAFESPDRVRVRQLQVYVIKDRIVHALSITHLEGEFEKQKEALFEIAGSFVVR